VVAGLAQAVQEVEQILGILAGGIETHDEVGGAMLRDDAFEALPQAGIAGGGLGEGQFGGGGLEVVAEEDGIMAVAGRVDADAEAAAVNNQTFFAPLGQASRAKFPRVGP
jgi:hypothetical protein